MKPIIVQPHHLARRIAERGPAYEAALMPAMVERLGNGSMVFDMDHPAWAMAAGKPVVDPLADVERDESRMVICEGCENFRGGTRWRGRFRLYTVSCKACGCGGRKLADGCPLGRF